MISGFARYELAKATVQLPVQTSDLDQANRESKKRVSGEARKKTRTGRTSKRPRGSSSENEDNTEAVTEQGEVEGKKKRRRKRQLGEVDMNISLPAMGEVDMNISLQQSSTVDTAASGDDYTVAQLSPLKVFGREEEEVKSAGEESDKSSPVPPTPPPKHALSSVSASKVHIHIHVNFSCCI